ncbi:hypothetical protein VIGAN_04253900 [Vigna angularis var. angularis]|uniref:Uncharacterized protein n=1 Tax=Vigna angularis var. angularis TaxID=157739 RepID=A0A0S3RWT6_PHAAN|nr:hypothetical protein VIGAN_04253900 [Vigna angularis var. angularis]
MSEGPLHLTFRDEGMSEHLGDHKELSLWVYPINYNRWIDFGNRAWWVTINLLGNMDCFVARLYTIYAWLLSRWWSSFCLRNKILVTSFYQII